MATIAQTTPSQGSATSSSYLGAQAIISSLFFIFGFITCMNDILVPHLKALFTLNYAQATLVQLAFFSSYFFVSIPSAKFCEKFGYKTGMWNGLLITGLGCLGLLLSAKTVEYPVFLASFFVLAGGITLIQVAANPYVTILGKPESSSFRLVMVQAFNSLGTTVAPILGTKLILEKGTASSIEAPYLVLALCLFALAGFVFISKLPKFSTASGEKDETTWSELFADRTLMMGTFGIFCYVGAEVAIGTFLISWLGEAQVLSLPAQDAGRYVSFYWGSAMVGRFLGGALLTKLFPPKVLVTFVCGALGLTALSVFSSGHLSMWAILLVGFCNSIMFPVIFSQSIQHLSRGKEKASGLLCTAIVGGALIPYIMGLVADSASLKVSFIVPWICYVYLLVFAARLARSRSVV